MRGFLIRLGSIPLRERPALTSRLEHGTLYRPTFGNPRQDRATADPGNGSPLVKGVQPVTYADACALTMEQPDLPLAASLIAGRAAGYQV